MRGFNNIQVLPPSDCSVNQVNVPIDVAMANHVSFQFTWVGSPVGSVSLYESNDGVNFDYILDSQFTPSGAGRKTIASKIDSRWVQAKWTAGMSSSGTIAMSVTTKGSGA